MWRLPWFGALADQLLFVLFGVFSHVSAWPLVKVVVLVVVDFGQALCSMLVDDHVILIEHLLPLCELLVMETASSFPSRQGGILLSAAEFHVVLRETLQGRLAFGQFGLELLHVIEESGVLRLDLINACLQLCLLDGHVFELADLSSELGCNLFLTARFRGREFGDDVLYLWRQGLHVILQDLLQLWLFWLSGPNADCLQLCLGVF